MLSLVPELVRPVHPWQDWRALRHLTRLFRQLQPDIVHTHSGKAGILGRLSAARAGVPVIVHTIHGPSFGSFQGPLPNLVFRAAERHAASVTTHFVVVADAMRQQYLAAGIGQRRPILQDPQRLQSHPIPHRPQRPRFARASRPCPGRYCGRQNRPLVQAQGTRRPVRPRARVGSDCPRLKFLLVGGGAWREQFHTRARSLGLQEHFVFTGLVPPETVPQLIGIMDLLVHLSLREGLPRALPQALAAGRPVVAYDCDGAREVCLDNETGFLVPPGDLSALRERLLQLTRDAALRARFGQRGQQFVRDRFTVERMVDDLHALYARLEPRVERTPTNTFKGGSLELDPRPLSLAHRR